MTAKQKNKPGQGRKPLAPELRRVRLNVRVKLQTETAIWNYCEVAQISAGEFIDKLVSGEIRREQSEF